MPELDGLELLRAMKLEWPDVPVIMLSTYENAPYVKRALVRRRRGIPAEGRYPRGPRTGDQRRDLRRRQPPVAAGHPDPVRGCGVLGRPTGNGTGSRRTGVQPDAARARHPGAPVRGSEQPLDRTEPLPVGEDREGAPGRDLPQARRHEPHAGRDDGRAVGRGSGARRGRGRSSESGTSQAATRSSRRTLRRTGSPWVRVALGTCSSSTSSRTARPRASTGGRTRSVRSSSRGRS